MVSSVEFAVSVSGVLSRKGWELASRARRRRLRLRISITRADTDGARLCLSEHRCLWHHASHTTPIICPYHGFVVRNAEPRTLARERSPEFEVVVDWVDRRPELITHSVCCCQLRFSPSDSILYNVIASTILQSKRGRHDSLHHLEHSRR